MALPYFPLEDGNFKLSMGLKPAPSGSWIKVDHDYEQQINIRRSLLQKQRSDVFASVKDASKAEHRVCQMVQETLKFQMPNLSSFKPLDDENDLVKAASLIQEDLVIMREGENGFNLISAVVCFPSAWNLKTKVGESIRNIHAPVPGVNKQIGHSIDLFFKNMKQEKLVERFNWGLYDREDLFQPDWWRSLQTPAKITRQTIGSGIFFRVERQTLQRIQDTQDALFTIRIYNTPLQEVAQDPIRARLLSRHISTMSNDFKSYKSILKYEDLLQEYLCRHF